MCAGIGVAGHATVTGGHVEWRVLVAVLPLMAAYAFLFSSLRASAAMLTGAAVAGQALVHLACEWLQPVTHTDVHQAAHHTATHAAHAGSFPWAMVLVHVLATIAGLVVLLRLEVAAWSRVADVASRIVGLLVAAFVAVLRHVPAAAPAHRFADQATVARRRWMSAGIGRRGPPAPSRA